MTAPPIMLFFLLTLGLGTSLTFTSSHWLLAWMGLEINSLAILPLMVSSHQARAIEASVKYLLIQATGAGIILWGTMLNAQATGHWNILDNKDDLATLVIMSGLALKLGLAPLHAWLPEVIQGTDMTTAMILSTWQKLAPFILMCEVSSSHQWLALTLGLISIAVGGLSGINMTLMRKLLAFSSIAHLGWMMLVMTFSTHLALIALMIYMVATMMIFSTLNTTSASTINSLALSWGKYPALTVLTPLILLSLGGLPPLSGFIPKWLIIQELVNQNLILIALIAALSALLSLYFYTRITYTLLCVTTPNYFGLAPFKHYRQKNINFPTILLGMMTIMLLPMLPLLTAFFFS
uniref:NADH-ubiquinone oxidoreductase chain 2 n=1 Tax=Cetonurus globiceps TaxID=1443080 RepID=A0A0H3U1S1_9TELE|nr:NADH dehydrogenase subunit 2 [Cetonurus globiceps]AHF49540.1 NADH dehydrogenase subunit 2 [Cetonurus globiceps]